MNHNSWYNILSKHTDIHRGGKSMSALKSIEKIIFSQSAPEMANVLKNEYGISIDFITFPTCSYSRNSQGSDISSAIYDFLTLVASNLSVLGLKKFHIYESDSNGQRSVTLSYYHEDEELAERRAFNGLEAISGKYAGDAMMFVDALADEKMLNIEISSDSSVIMENLASAIEKELNRSGIDLPVDSRWASVSIVITPGVDPDLAYNATYDAIVNFVHFNREQLKGAGYKDGQWEHSRDGENITLGYKFTLEDKEGFDIDQNIIIERFSEVLSNWRFNEISAAFYDMDENDQSRYSNLFSISAQNSIIGEVSELPTIDDINISLVSSEHMREHYGLVRQVGDGANWTIATLSERPGVTWSGDLVYKRRGDITESLTADDVYDSNMRSENNSFGEHNQLKNAIGRKKEMLDFICRSQGSDEPLRVDGEYILPSLLRDGIGQMMISKRYKTYIDILSPHMTDAHWDYMGREIPNYMIDFLVDDAQWAAYDKINLMTDGRYSSEMKVAADKNLVAYADDLEDLCPTFLSSYEDFVKIQNQVREGVDWEAHCHREGVYGSPSK
jgi:hypothetical protein